MSSCPFCGNRTKARKTGEHVIPKWMAREFPDATWAITDHLTKYVRKSTKYIHVTAPQPCATCNNEWMNDLEKLAQPIVRPLIHGNKATLSPYDQLAIGTWFCLRAMAYDLHCERYTPRPRYFEDSEYKRLMTTKTFEPSYSVYIGRYRPTKGGAGCTLEDHPFVVFADDPKHAPNNPIRTYAFTLAFEHLVLQIYCVKQPEIFKFRMPDLSDFCSQLGVDPVPLNWPPRFRLSSRTIKDFADRWSTYLEVRT